MTLPPHHEIGREIDRQKSLTAMVAEFFRLEAAGGIVLIAASIVALLVANTGLYEPYYYFLEKVKFSIGFTSAGGLDMQLNKSILLWINDGLMAVFFFLIGLEIKRELLEGELSSRDRALLPVLAAIGGMAVPAAIYWLVNMDVPANYPGWAIASATDIAFAVCMIALAGSRVPLSLKILLMAIAVIDDLGAILIIALFYSHGFNAGPLVFVALALAGLFLLNRRKVSAVFPYILLGVVLWVAVLQSGIHATLAGVVTALFIPLHCKRYRDFSPAKHLEHNLHPWVAFGVLPVFGLANAGVPFTGIGIDSLGDPLTLGIILGLVIGKPLGIFTVLFLAIKIGLSPMPQNTNWTQLLGLSILCGIGFTMSLFIGGLAFPGAEQQAAIRLGVLGGSLLSAVTGYLMLRYGPTNEVYKDQGLFESMEHELHAIFGKGEQADYAEPEHHRRKW